MYICESRTSNIILLYFRDLGNDHPISVGLNDENVITKYWIEGLPLKVITHGWLSSDSNSSGVFVIKTGIYDKLQVFL